MTRLCRQAIQPARMPGGTIRQCVCPALVRVPSVSLYPLPLNMVLFVERDQFAPQLAVLDCRAAAVPPTIALPSMDKMRYSIDEIA